MPHFHYCIHRLCHNRMRCDTDRTDCPRDDSFECLECAVRELKERRLSAFIEPVATVEQGKEVKKKKSKKDLAREAQMEVQRSL